MRYIKSLILKHFRNHDSTEVPFGPGLNLVFGTNGAGKTNVLEAIHYVCLGKSFLTTTDRHAVRRGADFFDLTATSVENDAPTTIRMTCVPGEGKRLFVNGAPLERIADVLGRFPIVVHSPDDHALTAGAPEERRRFVDSTLCQFRPAYTNHLIRYRRAVRQRNALLAEIRRRRAPVSSLDAWDHELVLHGAEIAAARSAFVREFEGYLLEAYRRLATVAETPSLTYRPAGVERASSPHEFGQAYAARLASSRRREIESMRTLVGPHRDEFVLALDDLELRRYASQGQHRTFGMALKLGEYSYLRERCATEPVLLLDDAFAHLDDGRTAAFADLFAGVDFGQTIMTAASVEPLADVLRDRVGEGLRLIEVSDGRIADHADSSFAYRQTS